MHYCMSQLIDELVKLHVKQDGGKMAMYLSVGLVQGEGGRGRIK